MIRFGVYYFTFDFKNVKQFLIECRLEELPYRRKTYEHANFNKWTITKLFFKQ